MRKRMKSVLALVLALLMAASVGVTAYAETLGPVLTQFGDSDAQRHTVANYQSAYASTNYRSESNYQMGAVSLPMDGSNGNPDICVPGLSSTDNMVPQGLTYWAAKGWILISAYSNGQGETSRIYALEMSTGNFVAQFNLATATGGAITDHVSGIAASNNNLYVASHGSTISYIPLSELDVAGGTVKTVRYADEVNLNGELNGANTSYASFGDGILWTGNFYIPNDSGYGTKANASSGSMLLGYNLSGHNSSAAEWAALKALKGNPSYCIPLDPNNAATSSTDNSDNNCIIKVQCATVKNGYCYVGTSYGRTNKSRIHIYSVDLSSSSGTIILANGVTKPRILMTSKMNKTHLPMTEGLFVHNGYLYNIFESACWQYNGQGNLSTHPTDVLWRFDVTTLLGIDRENDDAGIISKPAATTMSDLTFVVPETIYLAPNASSSTSSTSSSFQYYINNTSAGAPVTSGNRYDTSGKIYYTYSGASSATLSYSFYDADLNTKLSGGSVTLKDSNNNATSTISSGGSVNITTGTSPSLVAAAKGCYIQWKLSYTDSADSRLKAAYAYTYVYKTYPYPVFASTRDKHSNSIDADAQSMTWVSGIHSSDENGNRGILTDKFFPIAGTLSLPSNTKNDGGITQDNGGYHSESSSYPKTGRITDNSSSDSSANSTAQAVSPRGYLYVDTSRFSNLNQIPNFKIGFLISYVNESDQSCKYRWWGHYFSEANSSIYTVNSSATKNDWETYYKNDRGTYFSGYYDVTYEDGNHNVTREYCKPRLVYHSSWDKSISALTLTTTYAIKGAVRFGWRKEKTWFMDSEKSSSGMNSDVCMFNVIPSNKSALRTAVQNATKKMAAFGVNDVNNGNLLSWYFDGNVSGYKWNTFQTAYKAAVIALTKLDSTENFGTLATNLTNAMNALCTKVTFDANGGTLASGVDDSYPTIGQNPSVSFTIPSGYTATRSGYTFGGWSLNATALSGGVAAGSSITVGYNNTLYAVWLPHYTVSFDGGDGATGSTADQAFVYGTAQPLNANGFSKTATVTYVNNNGTANTTDTANFTFANWLGSPRLIDDATEYHYDNTSGSDYKNIKQWAIASPFAAGEVYHLEFDAKGSGKVTNYFYGNAGYWEVASSVGTIDTTPVTVTTTGGGDGDIRQDLAAGYQHYTVTWTLADSGNANVDKYVLFRAWPGSNVTFKNVVFWKETGAATYSNQQPVTNLCNVSGAVYQMRAQWTPGTVTLPSPSYANHALAGWYSDSTLQTLAGVAGVSYTVPEDTTLYAKWVRPAEDHTYVIDYGLPVDLTVLPSDLSGVTLNANGISTQDTGFTATKNQNSNTIRFTPTAALNAPVSFTYTVTYNSATYTGTVTVIPANSVYYEETFFYFGQESDTFDYDNNTAATWVTVGSAYDKVQEGAHPGSETSPVYGFDNAYTDNGMTYSLGRARYAEVSASHKGGATASFTFTGTGFDFYALTDNQSGLAFVDIYKQNANVTGGWENIESTMVNTYFGYKYGQLYLDAQDKVTLVANGNRPIYFAATGDTGSGTFFVDGTTRGTETPTYYDTNGTIVTGTSSDPTKIAYAYGWVAGENTGSVSGVYQVPVISRTGLTYGTYKVVIEPRWSARQNMTGGSSYKFYVDAVRVYDPINPTDITNTAAYDAYQTRGELSASYQSVRDLLITADSLGNTGGHGNAGIAFLEQGKGETLKDYKSIGPKNEVYLNPGQAIAFNLTTASTVQPAKLSLGLRQAEGTSGATVTVYSKDSTGVAVNVSGATELYRDISAAVAWQSTSGGNYTTSAPIIIVNTSASGKVISITNLKWSYNEIVSTQNRMLSFSFAPQDLTTVSAVLRQTAADAVAPDASGVRLQWNTNTIRRGGVATLTITAPSNFEKAYVNGAEVAGYTENADGTRTWRYTYTSSLVGKHAFDVQLADAGGYRTKAIAAENIDVVAATNGQKTITLRTLLEMIFGNFFEVLRTAFFKK